MSGINSVTEIQPISFTALPLTTEYIQVVCMQGDQRSWIETWTTDKPQIDWSTPNLFCANYHITKLYWFTVVTSCQEPGCTNLQYVSIDDAAFATTYGQWYNGNYGSYTCFLLKPYADVTSVDYDYFYKV